MEFLHSRLYLASGQCVEVDCDTRCNVLLTDDYNFQRYQAGEDFTYFGGWREYFPTQICPPHAGHWNVTIDLDDGEADIRYSIDVVG